MKLNKKDILALKVLILDKIEAEHKETLQTSDCSEKSFELLIEKDLDWINLLEKVNSL